MKTAHKKFCRSISAETSTAMGRAVLTPMLPARHCCCRSATAANVKSNFIKSSATMAVALALSGLNAVALLPSPSAAKAAPDVNPVVPSAKTTPVAPVAVPGPRAALPKALTPSTPQTHLAPAAPMISSSLPVSIEEDIRDIRSPRHLPSRWPWAAGAAGAFALAAIAYAMWKQQLRKALFAQLPYEIALGRLEDARCYMTPEQAREFCFAVSEIIRGYIEQRFNARAPRRTTEEFLYDLLEERHVMLTSQRTLLAEFLQHCDMAKFALWQFSVPEMEAMHLSARTFVLQTALEPEVSKKDEHALPKSPRVRLDPPIAAPPHTTPKPA
jgi:hypothetical protein